MKLHSNTKKVRCKKEHICEKCGKKIKVGQVGYRTNTKFIKPFYRCENCKPLEQEITNIIQEEMQEYHFKDDIIIEDDF